MATLRRELERWLETHEETGNIFYVKRLSANDTGRTGGHQVGVYIPSDVGRAAFPDLPWGERSNDQAVIRLRIVSHDINRDCATFKRYYRAKRECRVTNVRAEDGTSPLLDPTNTGSVTLFCFIQQDPGHNADTLEVWICSTAEEESLVEQWFGRPVEPGTAFWTRGLKAKGDLPRKEPAESAARRKASRYQLPPAWTAAFPSPAELVEAAVACAPAQLSPDETILARRAAEYVLFARVESEIVMRRLRCGFTDAEEFLSFARSVLNRRMSRSGLSLELHVERILVEHGFVPGVHFVRNPKIDGRSIPDFLFPNVATYENEDYPADRLRMLAVKTTLKERWRQILGEAKRIWPKHALTLDEGLSAKQLAEMLDRGLSIIVPAPLRRRYDKRNAQRLRTFGNFLAELHELYLS